MAWTRFAEIKTHPRTHGTYSRPTIGLVLDVEASGHEIELSRNRVVTAVLNLARGLPLEAMAGVRNGFGLGPLGESNAYHFSFVGFSRASAEGHHRFSVRSGEGAIDVHARTILDASVQPSRLQRERMRVLDYAPEGIHFDAVRPTLYGQVCIIGNGSFR